MRPGLDPINWLASGYTVSPPWLPWALGGLLGIPSALLLWLGWRVFRSGPRPGRDAVLTVVLLAVSALCAGIAYPRDPLMLVPAGIAAALAVGCSVRVHGGGRRALIAIVVASWVLWLPACGVLAIALR